MRAESPPMKPLLCLALLTAAALPAAAASPHEHGVARLDVAVEPARVTMLLEIPLDSLLGFEHEPKTDAERQQAAAAVARLRDAAAVFRIDPAAACTPTRVDLQSAALGLGNAAAGNGGGHEDLDANVEFACKDGHRAGFIEVGLFDAFARLQRVDVQAVTRKGQLKATLRRPVSRLPLAR